MKASIQKKFLFSVLFVLLILYACTCIGIIFYVQNLLTNQTIKNNKEMLEQASRQANTVFRLTDETAKQVMANQALSEIMEEVRTGDQSRKYILMSRANLLLKDYIYLNTFASAIAVITWDGEIYCNQNVFFNDFYKETIKEKWFVDFVNGDEKKIISDIHQVPSSPSSRDGIMLAYKFKNIEDYTSEYNYLLIEIPLSVLANQLINENAHAQLQVINKNAQTVIGDDQYTLELLDFCQNDPEASTFKTEKYMVTLYQSEIPEWYFFYLVPLAVFQRPVSIVISIMSGIFLSVAAITTLILLHILKKMMSPFYSIVATMKKIKSGDMDARVNIQTGDEFGVLAKGLDDLTIELKKHIGRLLEDERIKKQMEMDLLMSQIHPHFIYNTLNSAVYLIEEENNENAINIIYSLIALLQDTVKIGNKEIFSTTEKELELLSAYIQIAQIRYPDLFTLELDCDETLLQKQIPKVLIQPLAENAIYHGLLPAKKKGLVRVSIQKDENWLLITTEDNGVGISEKKLEQSLHRKAGSLRGVGLSNIQNRLEYLYPSPLSSFSVESKLGWGTRIVIRIPYSEDNSVSNL